MTDQTVYVVIQSTMGARGQITDRVARIFDTEAKAKRYAERSSTAWIMGDHDWHVEPWRVQ